MDYGGLGLKVGLEIHQELETRHKLFCRCPPRLFKGDPEYTFKRRLRPSQSELGEVDPAALFEFIQGKTIIYEANRETSCLVEMDEEPPGPLDEEALDTCLIFALMTGSRPVDEIQVMRKIVVDGSNTTGFQRTCVVSVGGSIEAGGRTYALEQICLEEDAARKIDEDDETIRYRIDRLGIPLIEISTAPELHSPKEAEEVALAIGRLLRATGRVRRGLGTIRQDLNISIEGGAQIEIKGLQELELISKVVEYEAQRQLSLLSIASELGGRGVSPSDLKEEFFDLTDLFASMDFPTIREALNGGRRVMALRLPGFGGLLDRELCPNLTLGREMADRARAWGGARMVLHIEELSRDLSSEEISLILSKTMTKEGEALFIVIDEEERCRRSLQALLVRAREAILGVPSETRAPNPDGTTRYTRPRPGAARMYPETDVFPIPITPERIERLRAALPETPQAKLRRLMEGYRLNEKLARQVIDSVYCELFEELAKETKVSPTVIAVTLTETMKSLEREGVRVGGVKEEALRSLFKLMGEGALTKEAIPEILRWISANPEASPEQALEALGLKPISGDELRLLVERQVKENMEMVARMGERAFGPLMGMVMSRVRGRARPEEVQLLLKETLKSISSR
ncbi:MAG: Glu-tRNA(Gln) amidotransferase subunit GatE [Candidatus Bathyarchaeia archaeon]|nr:Glu-tRNA(Gln) amidotransferase subunit GatE [Candidatus Bathyarchaeota archaeon]